MFMKRLKDLSQLTDGCTITLIKHGDVYVWEFLMIHPHNPKYILALNSVCQSGDKLYIPTLFEDNYFVGEYDRKFIMQERIKQYKMRISALERIINEIQDGNKNV